MILTHCRGCGLAFQSKAAARSADNVFPANRLGIRKGPVEDLLNRGIPAGPAGEADKGSITSHDCRNIDRERVRPCRVRDRVGKRQIQIRPVIGDVGRK